MALAEEVKNILMEELNLDSMPDDAKQEDYSEWDSLTYMRILASVESSFEIEISVKNINNFNSIGNIVKEIESNNDNS